MKNVGVFSAGLKNGEEEVEEEQVLIVREEQIKRPKIGIEKMRESREKGVRLWWRRVPALHKK